jgi:hypothetical protein
LKLLNIFIEINHKRMYSNEQKNIYFSIIGRPTDCGICRTSGRNYIAGSFGFYFRTIKMKRRVLLLTLMSIIYSILLYSAFTQLYVTGKIHVLDFIGIVMWTILFILELKKLIKDWRNVSQN